MGKRKHEGLDLVIEFWWNNSPRTDVVRVPRREIPLRRSNELTSAQFSARKTRPTPEIISYVENGVLLQLERARDVNGVEHVTVHLSLRKEGDGITEILLARFDLDLGDEYSGPEVCHCRRFQDLKARFWMEERRRRG